MTSNLLHLDSNAQPRMNPQPNQTNNIHFQNLPWEMSVLLCIICVCMPHVCGLHADSEGFLALTASRFSFFCRWVSYLGIDTWRPGLGRPRLSLLGMVGSSFGSVAMFQDWCVSFPYTHGFYSEPTVLYTNHLSAGTRRSSICRSSKRWSKK